MLSDLEVEVTEIQTLLRFLNDGVNWKILEEFQNLTFDLEVKVTKVQTHSRVLVDAPKWQGRIYHRAGTGNSETERKGHNTKCQDE